MFVVRAVTAMSEGTSTSAVVLIAGVIGLLVLILAAVFVILYYVQVLFAVILGFLFLGQIPDRYSIIGYVVIIGTALFRWHVTNKKEQIISAP